EIPESSDVENEQTDQNLNYSEEYFNISNMLFEENEVLDLTIVENSAERRIQACHSQKRNKNQWNQITNHM
ncbi:30655_t:CDS:2, partial [Racocetra persica]